MVFAFALSTIVFKAGGAEPVSPPMPPKSSQAPGLKGAMLVHAAERGEGALVNFHLARGIDVNTTDPEGRTALLGAIGSRQWKLVETLLQGGADPHAVDLRGRTALMGAVLAKEGRLVERLLELGADPRMADENGHTALHIALTTKQLDLTKRFLETTPDFDASCCKEHDLLGHALNTEDWTFIEPVLTRMPSTLRWNPQTRAWLTDALRTRNTGRIQLLLRKHEVAPTPEGRKQPLLAYALLENNQELFRLLLDCGADPNCPLETPAEKSFLDLIPKSTVRNYLSYEPGMNLLMLTAGLGRLEELKLLLEKGAKRGIPTRSKYKIVALHFAAWAQNPDAIQILLGNAPPPEQIRIEISIGDQRAHLIKNGVPVLSTTISTGRPGYPTPRGRFVITDKNRHHTSSIYKVKMPFFMRLSCREFGMHEGHAASPFASHGCIRLPGEMARRLFRDVPVGTLVTISQ
ncbi:MAG: ankyrin repeat domain-containing protein [Verrucomicrobiota bacterium]